MKSDMEGRCSCGSGLSYDECCGSSASLMATLQKALEEIDLVSLEKASAGAVRLIQQTAGKGIDDYDGLSPRQMHRILYYPFDSPDLVLFPACLDQEPQAPMVNLFMLLVEAIGPTGVKPTQTGNLPPSLCQELARAFLGEKEYRELTCAGEIRTELEFSELNTTRIVAETAGLIRKYKGRFIVGRECRTIIGRVGGAGIYPRLFETFARNFNWAYGHFGGSIPIIQQSFLFSLFLLKKHGVLWQPNSFYEDVFLRVLPSAVQQARPGGRQSAEEVLRSCYSARCLRSFASLLGLVETAEVEWSSSQFRLRKLPLLDSAVVFNLPGVL